MARPENEVADELARLNCRVDEQQLKALAQALVSGESVLDAFAVGKTVNYGYARALVVTSTEILFVTHEPGLFSAGNTAVYRMYWQDVASLSDDSRGWLRLGGYGGSAIQAGFTGDERRSEAFKRFVQRLQDRVAALKSSSNAGPARASDTLTAQLERLANLRERGHISDEEFDLAKKRLLTP